MAVLTIASLLSFFETENDFRLTFQLVERVFDGNVSYLNPFFISRLLSLISKSRKIILYNSCFADIVQSLENVCNIVRAAFAPGAPITPPPGCVDEPHM